MPRIRLVDIPLSAPRRYRLHPEFARRSPQLWMLAGRRALLMQERLPLHHQTVRTAMSNWPARQTWSGRQAESVASWARLSWRVKNNQQQFIPCNTINAKSWKAYAKTSPHCLQCRQCVREKTKKNRRLLCGFSHSRNNQAIMERSSRLDLVTNHALIFVGTRIDFNYVALADEQRHLHNVTMCVDGIFNLRIFQNVA